MTSEPEIVNRSMTPFGDRVVVMVTAETRERPSKLFLPDGARVRYDAPLTARVLDCGPACKEVKPGMDVLIVAHHDGVEVSIPGVGTHRIIGERACLAVITDPVVAELTDDEMVDRFTRFVDEFRSRARKRMLTDPEAAKLMYAKSVAAMHALGASGLN